MMRELWNRRSLRNERSNSSIPELDYSKGHSKSTFGYSKGCSESNHDWMTKNFLIEQPWMLLKTGVPLGEQLFLGVLLLFELLELLHLSNIRILIQFNYGYLYECFIQWSFFFVWASSSIQSFSRWVWQQ